MAIDTSSLMLALSGLSGNSLYGNSLLSGVSTSGSSNFQNIMLSALLGGSSALSSEGCPYCAAVYGKTGSTSGTGLKTAGNGKATGQELNQYFEEAEEKYGVSADLLRAVAKVGLSLERYVEQVLKYADQDLTQEVAASQTGAKNSSTSQSSGDGSIFTADDAKYLAEMAKIQMQMQSMAAFNTSLTGGVSSGGLI